jgi:hypothetical protein
MTDVLPQRPVTFNEILVEGFVLVQVTIMLGQTPCEPRLIDAAIETREGRRLYRLDKPITVGTEADESLRLHLCNASKNPRKQKSVTLILDSPEKR